MSQQIDVDSPETPAGNAEILAEIRAEQVRQAEILDALAALIPAMRAAAGLLDNPATRWKARKERRGGGS